MRRIALITFILLNSTTFGQSVLDSVNATMPQWPSMVFKTNPLVIMWSDVPLTAEFRLGMEYINGQHTSSEIVVSYLGKSPLVSIYEDTLAGEDIDLKIYGFRIQLSHKFYLNKWFPNQEHTFTNYSPQGMYIAPYLSMGQAKVTNRYLGQREAFMEISHFSLNIIFGRHFFYMNKLAIDVYGGFGYKNNVWEEHDGPDVVTHEPEYLGEYYNSNLKIVAGFNFGIHF